MDSYNWWQVGISIYAAIVATFVAALEIRRWIESGPRIRISYMEDARTMNIPTTEDDSLFAVTASNRGDAPTTLEHLVFIKKKSAWKKFRKEKDEGLIGTLPWIEGVTHRLPFVLEPGKSWTGFVTRSETLVEFLERGGVYVGVLANHQRRPILRRIVRHKKLASKSGPSD